MVTLQPSPCLPFLARLSIESKKMRRQKKEPSLLQNSQPRSNLSVSKPSFPTPILFNQTLQAQTRQQALDNILEDLEASIDRGIEIEPQIFSSLLEACYQMQAFDQGIRLHQLIPPKLLRKNIGVSSKLVRLYASCGLIDEAHELFDKMPRTGTNAFTWNALISGYTELGLFEDAMALYHQMKEEGSQPDCFTFPRVLKACAGLGSIKIGEAIHKHITDFGFDNDPYVLNALVDMYAKCGDIVKAREVFDSISHHDSISWNSMFVGYVRHDLLFEAMGIFQQMLKEGLEPDSVAISTILTRFSPSNLGFEIHAWVVRHGLDQHPSVVNSLISMYAEAGMLDHASALFEALPEKDVVSWNAIISASREDQQKVLRLFQRMESLGFCPDSITFTSLLSACSHCGSVEDGRWLFRRMEETYGIKAKMEHYACMVNLLGRAGLINEAFEFIGTRLNHEGGPPVWGALLYACSLHGNVSIGKVAAERLFELEPDNEHNFVLLMKIYRDAGKFEEEEKVIQMMKDRGLDLWD